MTTRLLSALFFGSILVVIPDIIVFIAIKLNYIDYYDIKEYFNAFFIDHQIYPLFMLASIGLGYLFIHSPFSRFVQYAYAGLILASLLTLSPKISRGFGESLFKESNRSILVDGTPYTVDIMYRGRQYIHVRPAGRDETVKLPLEIVEVK